MRDPLSKIQNRKETKEELSCQTGIHTLERTHENTKYQMMEEYLEKDDQFRKEKGQGNQHLPLDTVP